MHGEYEVEYSLLVETIQVVSKKKIKSMELKPLYC